MERRIRVIGLNATVGDVKKIAGDLRRLAWRGDPLPDGAGVAETAFKTTLDNLYLQFKVGVKTYEEAESAVSAAEAVFIKAELDEKMFHASSDLWKRIEAPAARFRKEKTVEAAEAFLNAVYNVEA